jgi:hypothetical protein
VYLLLDVLYGLRVSSGYVEMKSFGDMPFIYITLHLAGVAGGIVTSMIHRRRMWLNLTLLTAIILIPALFTYSNTILNYMNRFIFINLMLTPLGIATSGLLVRHLYIYKPNSGPINVEKQLP